MAFWSDILSIWWRVALQVHFLEISYIVALVGLMFEVHNDGDDYVTECQDDGQELSSKINKAVIFWMSCAQSLKGTAESMP